MKKAIFTVCSILTVCTVIFLACSKDDNAKYQVSYANQPGYGSGNNPNPNNLPSSTGTVNNPTPPPPTCTRSLTFDGTVCSTVSSSISANVISENAGCGSLTITFPGTGSPSSGSYTAVTGTPSAGQCNFSSGGSLAAGGVVTITTGSSNKATFSGMVCGTHTISGTACY